MLNIVGDTEQRPEEQDFSNKSSKHDDETDNKESVKSKSIQISLVLIYVTKFNR